jgi:hypothetical protein
MFACKKGDGAILACMAKYYAVVGMQIYFPQPYIPVL